MIGGMQPEFDALALSLSPPAHDPPADVLADAVVEGNLDRDRVRDRDPTDRDPTLPIDSFD